MSIKSPDRVDVQVGSRIRLLRQGAQMSQTDLAEQLGVTFQQVQKYEKGMNCIGAGRLTKIAAVLGMPVSELLGDDGAAQSNRRAVAEARSPLKLINRVGRPWMRSALWTLLTAARPSDMRRRISSGLSPSAIPIRSQAGRDLHAGDSITRSPEGRVPEVSTAATDPF